MWLRSGMQWRHSHKYTKNKWWTDKTLMSRHMLCWGLQSSIQQTTYRIYYSEIAPASQFNDFLKPFDHPLTYIVVREELTNLLAVLFGTGPIKALRDRDLFVFLAKDSSHFWCSCVVKTIPVPRQFINIRLIIKGLNRNDHVTSKSTTALDIIPCLIKIHVSYVCTGVFLIIVDTVTKSADK